MLLWFICAVLTAGALAALLIPLARPVRRAAEGAGAEAVLRDQLEEIEADRARGILADREAEAAKIELSRRALAAAAAAAARANRQAVPGRGSLALALAGAVPLLTLTLYLVYGSPSVPSGSAAAARPSLERAEIGALIAEVEARLRETPNDGRGWDVIAPVYLKLGRFSEAADAFARAARLEGETLRRLSGFADASVLAADGRVVAEAQRAYEKILRLEPGRLEARYWLALAKEQAGRLELALADYNSLLSDVPAEAAAWRNAVAGRIAEVAAHLAGKSAEVPGPRAEDVTAAMNLSPENRQKFIAGMVEGLAERLKHDGGDLAAWQRLINAYAVLGRDGDARRALKDAKTQFRSDGRALGELAALAKSLGLGS